MFHILASEIKIKIYTPKFVLEACSGIQWWATRVITRSLFTFNTLLLTFPFIATWWRMCCLFYNLTKCL